jgi:hypothetical protein
MVRCVELIGAWRLVSELDDSDHQAQGTGSGALLSLGPGARAMECSEPVHNDPSSISVLNSKQLYIYIYIYILEYISQ